MEIAGYALDVDGRIPDRDVVLLEDAVMMVLGKLSGAELHSVVVMGGRQEGPDWVADGYDLAVSFRGRRGTATLRRNASGDWRIRLPEELENAIDDLPV